MFDTIEGQIEIWDLTFLYQDIINKFYFKPSNIKKGSNIFTTLKYSNHKIGGILAFVSDENKINIYEISPDTIPDVAD